MNQEIIDYYNKTFQNNKDIKKHFEKQGKKVTSAQIKQALKDQSTKQVYNNKQNNNKLQIPITVPQYHYQCDLLFFEKYKDFNNGYIGLITIIDINTRFAFAYPIKDKSQEEIAQKFLQFIKNNKVEGLSFDDGKEFKNRKVQKLLDDYKISYIYFNKDKSQFAQMMIERFNRALRDKIKYYLDKSKVKRYYDELQFLVNVYNNSTHSMINQTPQESKDNNFKDNDKFDKKLDVIQNINNEFQIGDYVRIKKNKELFQKGNKKQSKNVYQIKSKIGNQYQVKKVNSDKILITPPFQLIKVNYTEQNQEQSKNNKGKVDKKESEIKNENKVKRKINKEQLDLNNIINKNKFLKENKIQYLKK